MTNQGRVTSDDDGHGHALSPVETDVHDEETVWVKALTKWKMALDDTHRLKHRELLDSVKAAAEEFNDVNRKFYIDHELKEAIT